MKFEPVDFLAEYVRYPSVSTDPAYGDGMDAAREFITGQLEGLGFAVETVSTPGHPILLATRTAGPGKPHVLLYGHYDVQPPDPLEKWSSPAFAPEVRGGRLYGRGAADNKGPQAVQLAALSRLLADDAELPLNITFLIEGEEEIGSPSFPEFLEKYKARLKEADFVLLSDTGSPSPEQITITTGLRGLVGAELVVKGPLSDLHSGIHGGAVMNPNQALAELVASLHDADGRVNLPGFYDDVLDPEPWEREELARYPAEAGAYREFLGVPAFHAEAGFTPFEAVRFRPTLEINGIGGGYQGEGSKTVIPSVAFAKITCRLVPNQEPEKVMAGLSRALAERCPEGVTVEVTAREGGMPYLSVPPDRPNTPGDQPEALARAFRSADKAVAEAFGSRPLYLREGGSVPIIGQMKAVAGLDSLMIGLFTPEDRLHAPDESFHLGLMEKGIEVYAEILRGIAYPERAAR